MNNRRAIILFLVILSLAFAARCVGLDRSFILDEFRTIKFASLPPAKILDAIRVDSYPPLSYLILSAWMAVSRDDVWIRLLFVIFGMISVSTTYHIGRELVDFKYAITAMFLMALMPIQVWSSQYARGIAPATSFLLLSTLFLLRLIRGGKTGFNMNTIGYVASAAGATYSFYYSFLVIAAQNLIYIFRNKESTRGVIRWLVIQASLAVLYLPWLRGFLTQLKEANIIMNFATTADAGLKLGAVPIGILIRAFSGLLGFDHAFLVNTAVSKYLIAKLSACNLPLCLAIFGVPIFLVLSYLIYLLVRFVKRTKNKELLYIFSVLGLTPFVLSLVLNMAFKTPVMSRYLSVSSAFLIFVYALGLYSLKDKKVFLLILASFVLFSLWRLSNFTKTIIDYKGSAIFTKNHIQDEDRLLFIGGDRAYEYYSGLPKNYISSEDYMRRYRIGSERSLGYLVNEAALEERLRTFDRLWVYNSGEQMTGIVKHVLGLIEKFGYRKIEERNFKNISVYRYAKR